MQKVVILTGPTACGKTSLSIKLAKYFNGEIISCDSMQIYKYLDIGTAKVTKEEMEGVSHHLIDIISPDKEFSVQEYVNLCTQKIEEISKQNKLPIIVGGTGLYIKALTNPYVFGRSKKDENIRNFYKNILEEKGKDFLYNLLLEKDEKSAQKIHKNDTKRVIRALEICDITGKKKSEINVCDTKSKYQFIIISLDTQRQELYSKINFRVDKMFEMGLVEELKNLLSKDMVNKNSQSMQAIGYKELFDYLEGKTSLEDTKELIKRHTRNYAKRQLTFIRGIENVTWFNVDEEDKIFRFLKEKLNGNK